MLTHLDWSSLTAPGPYLMPTGLCCCPLSTPLCVSLRKLPSVSFFFQLLSRAFPSLLLVASRPRAQAFGFAPKQTKRSSAWRTLFIVSQILVPNYLLLYICIYYFYFYTYFNNFGGVKIYSFRCTCGLQYIGRTGQRLDARIKQYVPTKIRQENYFADHINNTYRSAIAEHLINNGECASTYSLDLFTILSRSHSDFHHKVFETIYILTHKPSLCKQREYLWGLNVITI